MSVTATVTVTVTVIVTVTVHVTVTVTVHVTVTVTVTVTLDCLGRNGGTRATAQQGVTAAITAAISRRKMGDKGAAGGW